MSKFITDISNIVFSAAIFWLLINGFFIVFTGLSLQREASIYIGEKLGMIAVEVYKCEEHNNGN